jgi:hypothetical protein
MLPESMHRISGLLQAGRYHCDESRAADRRRDAAHFFALYRDLTAGSFYSTPAGRKDLNLIGNVPLARFDGPPPALLETLGLE